LRIFELVSNTEKDKTMNLKNKATVIATSVIAVAAIAIASPALASKNNTHSTSKVTSKSVSTATPTPTATTTPPTFGNGGGFGDNDGDGRGKHGRGPKGSFTPITKTVTVDVPATGTYKLLVTEVAPANAPTPPAGAPVRPAESFTVAVTGTGSQTVTLNLPHPGNYTVALISVVSTQDVTAN
jgi:hypothetical protein